MSGAALQMYEKLVSPSDTPLYDTWEKSWQRLLSVSQNSSDPEEWAVAIEDVRKVIKGDQAETEPLRTVTP